MSNNSCTPLFIFGVTVLSLILLATITSTPPFFFLYEVYAQEDEEEEDKEEEEEKGEKEESKDEEEEEKEEGSKEEEEEKGEQGQQGEPVEQTNNQTVLPPLSHQSPPQEGEQSLNFSQPTGQTTTTVEPITTTTEGVVKKEFNATCKCMTTPTAAGLAEKEPTKPETTTPNGQQQIQIPLTKADIQDSESFGQVIDPTYTSFYSVPNLLDNVINDVSFWSQAGKSSFYIKLDNALDSYQVCSAEVNVHDPTNKNIPYLLDVGVSQNYTGVLDQANEKIQFEKCVINMDEILMVFNNPPNSFVSIGEVKLFGSKVGQQQSPQQSTTLIPPTLEPQQQPPSPSTITTENATKINIQDSNAEIDIKNSTITFKFDPVTGIFKGTQ